MKKISKILLSSLAISSMFFTMSVNAEELTPTTPQEEQVETTSMGTELFESITKEKFDSIVPNTIDVTKTKNDFANSIISNGDNMDYAKEINEEVQTKIITLLENSGYMDTVEAEKEAIVAELSDPWYDFYTIRVSLNIGGKEISSKEVTINYAKESNFNATDETYVKNKVNGIKFANVEGNDAVITTYNVGDVENANKWTPNTYDFNKLLNDNSITIKKNFSQRSSNGGYTILFFYKNDVLYDVKSVMNLVMYGTTLENGTPVGMGKIYDTEDIYKELAKELENKGYTNILGAYELTAYGETYDNMKVSFNLGEDYNGKEVIILHKKSDGSYEIFSTTVAGGKAEITVSEFSPFMIALSGNTNTENANKAPNNLQTSSMNVILYASVALVSLIGIGYILIKNSKKKIA